MSTVGPSPPREPRRGRSGRSPDGPRARRATRWALTSLAVLALVALWYLDYRRLVNNVLGINTDLQRDLNFGLHFLETGYLPGEGPAVAGGALGFLFPGYFAWIGLGLWLFPGPSGFAAFVVAQRAAASLLALAIGRRLGGPVAGLVAALAMTWSLLETRYDHNLSYVFFTLLMILALVRFETGARRGWLLLVWLALGAAMSTHYLAITNAIVVLTVRLRSQRSAGPIGAIAGTVIVASTLLVPLLVGRAPFLPGIPAFVLLLALVLLSGFGAGSERARRARRWGLGAAAVAGLAIVAVSWGEGRVRLLLLELPLHWVGRSALSTSYGLDNWLAVLRVQLAAFPIAVLAWIPIARSRRGERWAPSQVSLLIFWSVGGLLSFAVFAVTGQPRHLYPLYLANALVIGWGAAAAWNLRPRRVHRTLVVCCALAMAVMAAPWLQVRNGVLDRASWASNRQLLESVAAATGLPAPLLPARVHGAFPPLPPVCGATTACPQIVRGLERTSRLGDASAPDPATHYFLSDVRRPELGPSPLSAVLVSDFVAFLYPFEPLTQMRDSFGRPWARPLMTPFDNGHRALLPAFRHGRPRACVEGCLLEGARRARGVPSEPDAIVVTLSSLGPSSTPPSRVELRVGGAAQEPATVRRWEDFVGATELAFFDVSGWPSEVTFAVWVESGELTPYYVDVSDGWLELAPTVPTN